jgi:hypothetical protein
MRFDGLSAPELPTDRQPTATLVKLAALHQDLSDDEPVVIEAERASAISARRAHVQEREDY